MKQKSVDHILICYSFAQIKILISNFNSSVSSMLLLFMPVRLLFQSNSLSKIWLADYNSCNYFDIDRPIKNDTTKIFLLHKVQLNSIQLKLKSTGHFISI